jgi:hypothetical protein
VTCPFRKFHPAKNLIQVQRETSNTLDILRLMHIQLDRALAVCLTVPM